MTRQERLKTRRKVALENLLRTHGARNASGATRAYRLGRPKEPVYPSINDKRLRHFVTNDNLKLRSALRLYEIGALQERIG